MKKTVIFNNITGEAVITKDRVLTLTEIITKCLEYGIIDNIIVYAEINGKKYYLNK